MHKKLHLKLRKPLILLASEYLSMREKEKTVSLVLLPTRLHLLPTSVTVSLILSTLCHFNINENGREIIVTKKGILTPVEPSDGIIPNDMTETLMKMAERQQNYAMNSNFKMPELKVKDASGNSVNNVYNTFTVQGDLTRDTLPELNKILDLASSKTQNDIRKNKRRFG